MSDSRSADLLVVDNGRPLPSAVERVIARGQLTTRRLPSCGDACRPEVLADAGIILVTGLDEDRSPGTARELDRLLDSIAGMRTSAIIMSPSSRRGQLRGDVLVRHLDPASTTPDELWGCLSTMLAYRPLIRRIEREIDNIERMGRRVNHHLTQLDQEMQLASRLQHEFLPRELPEVGPARFATVFRPASWVSGDIYDVCRLDEQHVGFYIADAVGHGVAAGLLTMFVKRSIWTKRIEGQDYSLITPDQALTALNQSLIMQNLPNSPFITACYCLLDTQTLEMSFARGGHPYPIHIGRDRRLTELRTSGGLLGLFDGEEFPARTVQLAPGDKVVLYSDGVELGFVEERDRDSGEPRFKEQFRTASSLPATEMAHRLSDMLDREAGSLNPQDDLTIIILAIAD